MLLTYAHLIEAATSSRTLLCEALISDYTAWLHLIDEKNRVQCTCRSDERSENNETAWKLEGKLRVAK